jgi:hypothetical protein
VLTQTAVRHWECGFSTPASVTTSLNRQRSRPILCEGGENLINSQDMRRLLTSENMWNGTIWLSSVTPNLFSIITASVSSEKPQWKPLTNALSLATEMPFPRSGLSAK